MRTPTKPESVCFGSTRNKAAMKLLTLAFLLKGMLACAALPAGWMDQDVGSPGLAGSASYANGIWTISGGGADIWNGGDQFNFCANSLTGDGMIIARVTSQSGSDSFAQTGVMIRNDSTAGSPEAAVLITPGNGVTFRYRLVSGGTTAQSIASGITAPVWVRLGRSANTFAAAYSSDGINWTQLGSPQIILMGGTALAGLAVTAHNNALINTGQVANVLIVPGPQVGVPSNLFNPYTSGKPFVGETTWPLPQLNVASNALTPRMGWNSWFVVGDATGPSESLIKSTAAALVTTGLAAAGYKYVVIDATWIASGRGYRDANGNLIVDPTRWPDGMKAVADYVHSKGLLMGGYSDIGASGYGNPAQIGGFGYYQQDADQFANWGWDFIKIDDHGPGDFYAAAHAIANNDPGRPIVISFSTPQVDRRFFASRLANSWRVANDISGLSGSVSWSSILTEFDTAQADWYAQAPGHWLDPDMLMVGFNGISDLEGRTHFNLWCILGAPLMIGTDVRASGGNLAPGITTATINTLTNADVIAVDQDALGAVGRPVASSTAVYAKPLGSFTSGQLAVLLLNRSSVAANITVNWSDLGLAPGSPAAVRDLWAHQNLGNFTGSYTSTNIPAHGSTMLTIAGAFDWSRPRTYEAESSYNSFSGTAYYVPENPNFSSGAYVTGVGFGATNAFQFNQVAAPSNGLYEVDIYYACGADRTAQLSVNGGTTTNLSFAATGGDTNQVGVMPVYLQLSAGENTLTFGNLTNLAPNFDKIVVSLGTPADLQAVAGDGQVNLSWSGPAAGATFNVNRGASSGGEIFLVGGLVTTNFTDTAVTNGMNYFYTVTENNPALTGESPPSAEVSARPRFATTSFAYPLAALSNNPVAYWRFSETSGPTAADSAGGYNGAYGSAVTRGVAGPRPADFLGFEITNTAAQFANGVNNSWITIPALNLNTNQVTITAWIYPAGNQAAYTGLVFCRSGGTVSGMNLNGAGTDLGYTWNNNSGTWGWNSGVQPPANQWSFVALVVQPAGATVYLINTNGQQSATNAVANPNQAFAGAGTIGTDTYSSAVRAFNGIMDEVAVFNHALTPAQLQQLYANGHQLARVQVGLQKIGGHLNLTWPQGTLLQSPNVNGPWSAVSGISSQFTAPLTNSSMFYRVFLQ
jgi:Alpha galactosidase A/Concanavalin A-like lectin/glucanases superfamily/Alpha galactosidase C-terminal beta sandwich domain/Alpha-galactosidase, CBM13 domain